MADNVTLPGTAEVVATDFVSSTHYQRVKIDVGAEGAAGGPWTGAVAGYSTVVSVTPTVSASPDYSINDAVGGKQTLANAVRVSGGTAVLQSIQITDAANVKPQMEILFFDSDPSSATITDNSGFTFSTDIAKLIGRVSVVTSDYVGGIGSTPYAIAHLSNLGRLLKANGSTSLYVAVVAQAGINLAGTSDLRFDYGFLED